MRLFLRRKLISFALTIFLANLATFVILQILPGDPALLMLGTEGSPEAYLRLRSRLNLDQPLLKRYFSWLFDFIRGRWGVSLRYSLPVSQLVAGAWPLSLFLALAAVILAAAAAVVGGIFMAVRPRSAGGRLLSLASQAGMALPQFWLGLLLIRIFAVKLRLVPAGGSSARGSLLLPVLTLALPRAAVLSRLVKVGMAETLKQDYIRTARAKGLSFWQVLFKHALRNGSLAFSTAAGLQFSQLFAGSIVVEQVFGLPGLGQLLLAGVLQRDLPLVQVLSMLLVVMILSFNLLFDLWLGLLDPRLRYE